MQLVKIETANGDRYFNPTAIQSVDAGSGSGSQVRINGVSSPVASTKSQADVVADVNAALA